MSKKANFFQYKGSSHINSLESFRESQSTALASTNCINVLAGLRITPANQKSMLFITTLLLFSSTVVPAVQAYNADNLPPSEPPPMPESSPDGVKLDVVGGTPGIKHCDGPNCNSYSYNPYTDTHAARHEHTTNEGASFFIEGSGSPTQQTSKVEAGFTIPVGTP